MVDSAEHLLCLVQIYFGKLLKPTRISVSARLENDLVL